MIISHTQKQVITFLVKIFADNDIEYQTTGGLASIAYGGTRSLYDIDIDIYKKDVQKVRGLFFEYITEDWNNEIDGEEDNFNLWIMSLNIKGISIDISQIEESYVRKIGGKWVKQPEKMDVEIRTVEGIKLRVQNKTDLINYKLLVARDTDKQDVNQIQT